jgi:hypothetical protein
MNGITILLVAAMLFMINKHRKQRDQARYWKQAALDINKQLNDKVKWL